MLLLDEQNDQELKKISSLLHIIKNEIQKQIDEVKKLELKRRQRGV